MATRKQKHAAALARREAYLAEVRQLGQDAIRQGAEKRRLTAERLADEAEKVNKRHRRILAANAVQQAGQKLLDSVRSSESDDPSDGERPDQDYMGLEEGIDLTRIKSTVTS